ncbi:MAG: NAD(P)/FAD-dependent oxidoreductase [Clostridiales bacterium]|jgi:protoporphyrinogen oxidase|nr:NAD(P)/FAD-dependent oxidoreductase [Clostridiales bacterium]
MKIGIIGCGATGLSAGYTLSQKGHETVLYDTSESELGGIAGAVPIGRTYIDKFYRHIFTSDAEILSLIQEAGLNSEMMWIEPKNGMYIDGKLYPFTNPIDLIMFPAVGFISRIRMGLAVLSAKYVTDYKAMEGITAKEWLVKKAGKQSYDKIWSTLLHSKFDKDSDKVSGVWIWNKFKLRGSTRQNLNKESLGYLRGGFFQLYKKLAEIIKGNGGRFVFESVARISPEADGKIGIETARGYEVYDKVLFTAAADLLVQLCNFPNEYLEKVSKIKHKSNICMTLVADRQISDFYWVTIAERDSPFVLYIEHTNLVKDEAYDGKHIIYLSRYIDSSDPFFSASDEEIKRVFLSYLPKLFPGFSPKDASSWHIFRSVHSQPVVGLRYSDDVLPQETPIANLHLASMAQIYPEDRGQNYAVAKGISAAKKMIGE